MISMASMTSRANRIRTAPGLLLLLLGACGPATEGAAPGDGSALVFVTDPDSEAAGPIGPALDSGPDRPYFHDFGSVPDGEVVTHVFRMRNSDPRPLTVTRIVPGCGCTVPTIRYLKEDGTAVEGAQVGADTEELLTIPPGALVEIELRIDTKDIRQKNLDKLLIVTVTTDSPNGYYQNLEAHIIVSRPFEIVPAAINMGRIPANGGGVAALDVVPAGGYDHSLGEIVSQPASTSVNLERFEQGDRGGWKLTVRLEPPLDLGLWKDEVVLSTLDPLGEPGIEIRVPVSALVVGDISADPPRLAFYADPGAVAQTRLRSLLTGQRLRVLAAAVEPDHADMLAVRFEPVGHAPDDGHDHGSAEESDDWTLFLEPVPPLSAPGGVLRGSVRVTLDDAQNPELLVPYVVHLRE